MAIESGPRSGGATILGDAYNSLRQDVLRNHDHSGGGNGTKVDHVDLENKGAKTHATIDSELNTLLTRASWNKIVFGEYDQDTMTSGTGWTSENFEYNGSEGRRIVLTFDPILPSVPLALVTVNAGSYSGIVVFGLVVASRSTAGFEVVFRRSTDDLNYPLRFSFIAICP
jgi:hypothetical protein